MKSSVFLKAEWRNLILANYEVNPDILTRYLPPCTELDTFNGVHYISLVGFLFKDTRVKGVIVPFHRTFEEINLRFYVRTMQEGQWRRGVVFIKEIVPKKLIALVANKVYGENYEACDTRHTWSYPEPEKLSVEYMWRYGDQLNWITAEAEGMARYPLKGSKEEFICEHYFGYTKDKQGHTTEYGVEHPQWRMHKVMHYSIRCQFDKVYGPEFAFLNSSTPKSVFLADGSEITVRNKNRLTIEQLA